jgi:hypothetical protein
MLVVVRDGRTKERMRGIIVKIEGIGAGVSRFTEAHLSRIQERKMMLLGVHLGPKEEGKGVEDKQDIKGTEAI